ncbi:MAG: transposase [Planctomycetales bacterium]|nr:transposase [Planctomycetales bacterium]MCA9222209.1 transposase [Planctomycetales bacterium]
MSDNFWRVLIMIHGYHVIWGTYGFWLPNDPRGSWSDFVYSWEIARFGKATKSSDRSVVDPKQYATWRAVARRSLKNPPVKLTGSQALEAARGFARFTEKSNLTVWACSILPEHVHFVLGRHHYKIESAANLLKGEATRQLIETGLHPMAEHRTSKGRWPSMWGESQWIVYLDTEEAIENAIRYVEENPEREGMKRQRWSFVRKFTGVSKNGWTTYH